MKPDEDFAQTVGAVLGLLIVCALAFVVTLTLIGVGLALLYAIMDVLGA